MSDFLGIEISGVGFSATGDAVDLVTGGRLGVGLSSGVSSCTTSGLGISAGLGEAVTLGARIIGTVRLRGPGLIGRTGSKYCASGVFASTGASVSIEALGSAFGNGVSP